jgi:potassium/chloride transporter 9
MSGDLRSPSKAIPKGTLWAMLTTFIIYVMVVFSLAATTTRASLQANSNIIALTTLFKPVILAGECAVTFFSALMGIIGGAKLFQVLARDKLLPGLAVFGNGTGKNDDPLSAVLLTYLLAQLSLFADLNQIATLISMGYLVSPFESYELSIPKMLSLQAMHYNCYYQHRISTNLPR